MLIAFTGRAGSGKSTAAQHLVDRHGYLKLPFAGPLKGMCQALGLSQAEWSDPGLKNRPHPDFGYKSPRHIMQTLGTEWGRETIDEDIWVNAWRRKLPRDYANIVADDARFNNEVAAVLRLDGVVIRINRISSDTAVTHPSEVVPTYYDGVINNEGDIATLKRLVDETMTTLRDVRGARRKML